MYQEMVGDYMIIREIGKGGFAVVYEGQNLTSGLRCAIKMINKEENRNYKEEIAIMKKLQHPLVPLLYEVIEYEDIIYMIMEYFEGDTLLNYVNLRGHLQEDVARQIFGQIIMIMQFLDSINIMHRDIKTENILINKLNEIMIIDFGFSREYQELANKFTTFCGSPAYCSPEMVLGNNYTISSDIWSAGVILFAMIEGKLPFDSQNLQQILQMIVTKHPHVTKSVSESCVDLISKILEKDPENRIKLSEILEHPWLGKFKESQTHTQLSRVIDEVLVDPENLDTQALGRYPILSNNVSQVQEELRNNSFSAMTAAYKYSRKLNLLRARLTAKSSLSLSGFMRQRTGFLNGPESIRKFCTSRKIIESNPKIRPPTVIPMPEFHSKQLPALPRIKFLSSPNPLNTMSHKGVAFRTRRKSGPPTPEPTYFVSSD